MKINLKVKHNIYKHMKKELKFNAFSKSVLLCELQNLRCRLFKKLHLYYVGNFNIQGLIIKEFQIDTHTHTFIIGHL